MGGEGGSENGLVCAGGTIRCSFVLLSLMDVVSVGASHYQVE